MKSYEQDSHHIGGIVGRFANRIAGGTFSLGSQAVHVSKNEGNAHCLHGGFVGFDKKHWEVTSHSENQVCLRCDSPAGEEGFPGQVSVSARYTLSETKLVLDWKAHCSATTLVNLCSHAYFNLSPKDTHIGQHELQVLLPWYLECNQDNIPTGEFKETERLFPGFSKRPQLLENRNWDHHFVGHQQATHDNRSLKAQALLHHPQNGRRLRVHSTTPGLQVYTGQHLPNETLFHNRPVSGSRAGICLESQYYPDCPNHPHFPQCVLQPGEIAQESVCFDFEN